MKRFENCNKAQLAVLTAIANGEQSSTHDADIVEQLVEMNLLEPVDGGHTVPVLVWYQLKKFLET
jgi:hypothetical protein